MISYESNHVTIGCDVDSSGVFCSLDVFGSKDLEELWVNGPSEEMQRMFCDSGTDRKHVGTFRRGMSWAGRDYSTRIMGQPISTLQLLYHEFFSFADFVPPTFFRCRAILLLTSSFDGFGKQIALALIQSGNSLCYDYGRVAMFKWLHDQFPFVFSSPFLHADEPKA
jgi:hypothetical protein